MVAKQIKPAAVAAKIGADIGWHTFRHTYSSMLRQLGVDVKVQQELLRHADAGTTLNLYTQAISEQSAQRIPGGAHRASSSRSWQKPSNWTFLDRNEKLILLRSLCLMVGAIGFESS